MLAERVTVNDRVQRLRAGLQPRRTAASRVAQPEEIAEAVGVLAGEGMAYVTGVALVIDGGMTSTIMI